MHTEQLIQRLQAEFGSRFHDVRHLMLRHRTNYPHPVNFDELIGIAVHHTAFHGMWQHAAAYHVSKGWPTIAYTVGISYGRVFLLKNVEEMGHHVWGMNEKLLSVVVMGDLTKKEPYIDDIPMLEEVIGCYDALMGRELQVKGHADWARSGYGTLCPGPSLRRWARSYERGLISVRSLESLELSEEEMSPISSYDISPPILASMELRGDEPLGSEQHTEKYCFSLGKQGLYVWGKENDEVMLLAGERVMRHE